MGFRGEEFAFGSPAEAVAGMLARLGPDRLGVEPCGLSEARGRVLAEAVRADRDSPAFDHSAMDGFAVRLADLGKGGAIPVAGEVLIGTAPGVMPEGAVRIVTGAATPAGAEAVVRREDVEERAGAIVPRAGLAGRVRAGENIRRRGENGRAGAVVLEAGAELSVSAAGTLAAVGCVRPVVFRRVRAAVITTGDELVAPGGTPGAYEVRDSNGPVVAGVLGAHGWIEVVSCVHVRDEGPGLAARLGRAVAEADAVVLTGGVSMGHRDPVRGAVEALGAEVVFHGLPQRPGKPMLGAIARRGSAPAAVFGLPGNPVSAMVTCTRIVVPVLAGLAGAVRRPGAPKVRVEGWDGKALDLWHHRLVRLREDGAAELVDGRGSGDILAGGRSDGFIEVPPGASGGEAWFPFYAWAR